DEGVVKALQSYSDFLFCCHGFASFFDLLGASTFTPCRAFLFRPYKIRGNLPHRCARLVKARRFSPGEGAKNILLSPG
ncbi:MAG: hypothetical protein IJY20_00515, partial [Clostridia bacterium]|nr:hypothetical protein [Clostridia bacterium]